MRRTPRGRQPWRRSAPDQGIVSAEDPEASGPPARLALLASTRDGGLGPGPEADPRSTRGAAAGGIGESARSTPTRRGIRRAAGHHDPGLVCRPDPGPVAEAGL